MYKRIPLKCMCILREKKKQASFEHSKNSKHIQSFPNEILALHLIRVDM